MNESELAAHIARLQQAMLDGKIDRATYEQLKADLRPEAAEKRLERSAGEKPAASAEAKSAAAPNSISPSAPPGSAPPTSPSHTPRVSNLANLAVNPAKSAAGPPVNAPLDKPPPSPPPSTGERSCFVPAVSLALEERASTAGQMETAPPIKRQIARRLIARAKQREWQSFIVGIGSLGGVLAGFQIFAASRNVFLAAIWGLVVAAICAVITALWSFGLEAAELTRLNSSNYGRTIKSTAIAWILLGIGGLYWMGLGAGFGSLIGRLLEQRAGIGGAEIGQLLGMLVGFAKAAVELRRRRERAATDEA